MLSNRPPRRGLPDISGLVRAPAAIWPTLGERLRELGLKADVVGPMARAGTDVPEAMRAPLRRWAAEQLDDPLGSAIQLLVFGLAVSQPHAEAALGRDLTAHLLEAGLLEWRSAKELGSPFSISLVNELFVICDDLAHGGSAVMGAGQTTADLCQAAHPRRRLGSSLDLGCGAGTAALLFASQAADSVGSDINDRALALAGINAHLNQVENVTFVQGDLFDATPDRRFDLIVSQPPWVPRLKGTPAATYLYGGRRGDELPIRLLAQLPAHLATGGRAVLLIEWMLTDDVQVEQRVREAVGDRAISILILRFPTQVSLGPYCAHYAAFFHPRLGPKYESMVMRMRDQLERLGVRGFQPTLIVLQQATDSPAWISTVDASSASAVTSERVDGLVAIRDLLAQDDETLLMQALRVPSDLILNQERRVHGHHEAKNRLRQDDRPLFAEMDVNSAALALLQEVDTSPTLRDAVRILRGRTEGLSEEAVLQGVRDALQRGLLEPWTAPQS